MAEYIFQAPYLSIAGTDVSDQVRSLRFQLGGRTDDATASGDTVEKQVFTLASYSLEVEANQDYATLDQTLWNAHGQVVAFEVRPSRGAVSASNPRYSFQATLLEYEPFNGQSGGVVRTTIRIAPYGPVTRSTT